MSELKRRAVGKVTHLNFQVKETVRRVTSRIRSVVFMTNQETYDRLQWLIAEGAASSEREILARALEQYLGLEPGQADPPEA